MIGATISAWYPAELNALEFSECKDDDGGSTHQGLPPK